MMVEITNRTNGPLQLMVRSRVVARGFTTLVLPGRGRNKNTINIADEAMTEQIVRLESLDLISKRQIPNK